MTVTTAVADEFLENLAERVAERVAGKIGTSPWDERWMGVGDVSSYLRTTPNAIRGMVKRDQIPVYRTPTGRLLFDRVEIDAWVRSAREAQV